jgi:hypothetical protein
MAHKAARSSKTGKFVTKKYAQKHPSTTEIETIPDAKKHRSNPKKDK